MAQASPAPPQGEGVTRKQMMSAQERRQKLIAAALRVMRREGIAALTTRAICAEADMPHGAFHYCFRSKRELYTDLCESIEIDLGDSWPDISPANSAEENIRKVLHRFWEQVEAYPDLHQIAAEMHGVVLRDPELMDLPTWEHGMSVERTIGHINRLASEAKLRFHTDYRTLAELLIASFDGLVFSWMAHRDGARARRSLDLFAGVLATLAHPA